MMMKIKVLDCALALPIPTGALTSYQIEGEVSTSSTAVVEPSSSTIQEAIEKTQVATNVPAEAPSNVVRATIVVETMTTSQQIARVTDNDKVQVVRET